jgi:hypothetical protein
MPVVVHGVIEGAFYNNNSTMRTTVKWLPHDGDPYSMCGITATRDCVDSLRGIDWSAHVAELANTESDNKTLCPICVSRFLLAAFRTRGCVGCAHRNFERDAIAAQDQEKYNSAHNDDDNSDEQQQQ